MCMPRRIVIRVAQALNEKWQKELQHYERMTDEVRVSDSISAEVALDEELGDLAHQGLEQCLAEGFRGWQAAGEAYVTEVEGVKATFSPKTRRITLSASVADVITAVVEKKTNVSERFAKELGMDLDLGLGNWATEDRIEALERRMRAQLENEMEADKRAKIEAAQAKLRLDAKRELAEKWAAAGQAKRRELGALVLERLHASRAEVEAEVNHLLSESYRRGLLLLARQQNGRVTREEESGSVIDLEITL